MFNHRLNLLERSLTDCEVTQSRGACSVDEGLEVMADMLQTVEKRRGIVYIIGNGGSAGIASHIASDFLKTLQIPAQTLYDSNLMTCLSNDWGYEHVFRYPLSKLLRPNDLLIAISSSGKSQNIVQAVLEAQNAKIPIITLSGFAANNPLRTYGDLNFWIDANDYGLIESAHFFLLHSLIDLWPQLKGKHVSCASTAY